MRDEKTTKEPLIDELVQVRQGVAGNEMHEVQKVSYRLLVENSPDIMYILDPEGHFCFVGGAIESLLGFTAEELTGEHFTSVIWPEDIKKAAWIFYERRTVKRSTKRFEIRMTTREGKRKHVDINYLPVELHAFGFYDKPISATDKNFLGTYGVARDITEFKRAEEALRESEEKYRLLVENANEAIFVSQDEMLKFVNPKTVEITGYTKEELTSRHFADFIHPADREIVLEHQQELLRDELLPRVCSFRIVDKNGNIRWVEANVVTIPWEGRPATLNLNSDVTDRKQAEEATRVAYAELNQIFQTAGGGMRVIDKDFNVLRINEAFSSLSGSGEAEAVGKKCYEGFPGPMCHTRQCPLSRILAGEERVECEVEKYRSDGTRILCIVTATHFRGPGGEVIGIVEDFKDITECKRAEEELRKHREHLEQLVEERTKELREAQQKLVQQEKLAVLGQLAGGVGHELRNPLGAIKNAGYLINMVLEKSDPEVKESLEIIEKEVEISERVIASLLDFARPKPCTRLKIDINDVVQAALSRVPVPENVEMVRQLSETLPTILADADQLRQVFENLTLNAEQAMTEGGRLVVKSEALSPERVTISFTDTGVGMDRETLGKVFEPLFTTKSKGIGLGLALTKKLLEANGATIEVQSAVGEGSTFTVKLPVG